MLCADENGASAFGRDVETEDEIMEKALAIRPEAVMKITAFQRERRAGRGGNLRADRLQSQRVLLLWLWQKIQEAQRDQLT